MLGSVVGSYRIVRQIGEGGMGRVYLAEHQVIGKSAALKVLLPQYSANPDVVTRFFNEARASSLLKHPSVIDIYDFGKMEDGSAFIVMEYLDGESLGTRLQRERRLSVELIVEIGRQVAGALGAAHGRGIVHRDLKPDNIFLVSDPDTRLGLRVKILDFGIAKLTHDTGEDKGRGTRTGAIIGTPTYMSPEQCRGAGRVDHRTDVYALGCVMFEMAVGQPPFVGEGPGDIIAAHMFQEPMSLSETLPERLGTLVGRMLAKLPDARFQKMSDIVAELSAPPSAMTSPHARSSEPLPTVRMEMPVSTPAPTHLDPGATRFVSSTTLGASTGEVVGNEPPSVPSSRRRLLVGGVAATTLVLMAGTLAIFERSPASTPLALTKVPTTEASPAAAPSAARRVTLHLDSVPSGAEVFRSADGFRVGTTPLHQQLDASSAEMVFRVKMRGYKDAETTIPLERDVTRTVALDRVSSHHAHATSSGAAEAPVQKKPSKNGVVDPFDN